MIRKKSFTGISKDMGLDGANRNCLTKRELSITRNRSFGSLRHRRQRAHGPQFLLASIVIGTPSKRISPWSLDLNSLGLAAWRVCSKAIKTNVLSKTGKPDASVFPGSSVVPMRLNAEYTLFRERI
jgi:hypothetical protein